MVMIFGWMDGWLDMVMIFGWMDGWLMSRYGNDIVIG